MSIWKILRKKEKRVTFGSITVTAMILIVIEVMNIVVYFIEFLRYIFPSIVAASILTSVKGSCTTSDLITRFKKFWNLYFPILWKFAYFFKQAFLFAHQWIHFLLSYERFVFFCQPFHARRKCTQERMGIGIAIIIIASLLCSLPYFFEYELTIYTYTTDGNVQSIPISFSWFYLNAFL